MFVLEIKSYKLSVHMSLCIKRCRAPSMAPILWAVYIFCFLCTVVVSMTAVALKIKNVPLELHPVVPPEKMDMSNEKVSDTKTPSDVSDREPKEDNAENYEEDETEKKTGKKGNERETTPNPQFRR